MNNNTNTNSISNKATGDDIRLLTLNIMHSIQSVRDDIENLKKSETIQESYNSQLSEANASLCGLNSLMGDIIGYTVADDIWERQPVSLKG
ncbi:MAG: hypothetical protein PHI48_06330 [Bacteroidales bacterium]|nr:hypothetical protein [Bacteroidales bacterium]